MRIITLSLALFFLITTVFAQELEMPQWQKVEKKNSLGDLCQYPLHQHHRTARFQQIVSETSELEPNNSTAQANSVQLISGQQTDVLGSITRNDLDAFRVSLEKGDILGIAAIGAGLDTVIAVFDENGLLVSNDDHGGISGIYPANAPFPVPSGNTDSAMTWIAPKSGTFFVAISGFDANSTGDYRLQIGSTRAFLETQPRGTKQIIFLDFDGETINALQLFGTGNSSATLSPITDFLTRWNLSAAEERAVVDAVVAAVSRDLGHLRQINGELDFEIRNSLDHADPFGQPNVSRVVVGGTIPELGISTIGIASSIDPGNFGTEDTAVVLLDLLSESAGNPNSINSFQLAPGFSQIDAVGLIVGKIISHEVGHFLGNWHTDNRNLDGCIMDQGGNLPNTIGVGADGILGSADDIEVNFIGDPYIGNEGVASGVERTDVRTAFALSVGKE